MQINTALHIMLQTCINLHQANLGYVTLCKDNLHYAQLILHYKLDYVTLRQCNIHCKHSLHYFIVISIKLHQCNLRHVSAFYIMLRYHNLHNVNAIHVVTNVTLYQCHLLNTILLHYVTLMYFSPYVKAIVIMLP